MPMRLPKLLQQAVRIEIADGSSFDCPMLPVSAFAEYQNIIELLQAVRTPADCDKCNAKLIDLISSVMPEPYKSNLKRLAQEQLAQLAAYLVYGDENGDDLPGDVKKNVALEMTQSQEN